MTYKSVIDKVNHELSWARSFNDTEKISFWEQILAALMDSGEK